MIGLKQDGSKAGSILDLFAGFFRRLGVTKIATNFAIHSTPKQVNWYALKAAKELEAMRERPDIDQYRVLTRKVY